MISLTWDSTPETIDCVGPSLLVLRGIMTATLVRDWSVAVRWRDDPEANGETCSGEQQSDADKCYKTGLGKLRTTKKMTTGLDLQPPRELARESWQPLQQVRTRAWGLVMQGRGLGEWKIET